MQNGYLYLYVRRDEVYGMRASNEKIIIIDFGSPLNKVMTRKIRELNVYSELVSPTITAEEVKA